MPSERKEYLKKYRQEHKKEHLAYMLAWQAKNKEKVKEYRAKSRKKLSNSGYYHSEVYRLLKNRQTRKVRIAVLTYYGNGVLECVCCGEDIPRFLTIDHINGKGKEDRSRFKGAGQFYSHLRRMGFPPGYRTLCFNCNSGRAFNKGVCPHEQENIFLPQ